MGNNLVSFFLPILSCLALTGTGFGVWVFNSTNASGETTHANYTVTSAASVNSLTAVLDSNNKEIILDENSTDMNVDVSVSSYIDFQRGMIGKYQISSYQYSSVTDLIKIAVDYQLVFSFEGNIGKYIEVKDVKLASNSQELTEKASAEKQTFIYTKNYDNSDQDGNDSFSKNDSVKYSVDFNWISGHFPTDQKSFTQMITDIKDETNPSKITITASVLDARSL